MEKAAPWKLEEITESLSTKSTVAPKYSNHESYTKHKSSQFTDLIYVEAFLICIQIVTVLIWGSILEFLTDMCFPLCKII